MRLKVIFLVVMLHSWFFPPIVPGTAFAENTRVKHLIVTSDTILSGMVEALLPADRFKVEAILPPGQCPGHYDVKLSDIEKMKKANLVITVHGMPFMEKAGPGGRNRLVIDNRARNWMAPDSYIFGLRRFAGELSIRFPEHREEIAKREKATIRLIQDEAQILKQQTKRAGIPGHAILASSMQKEPLEWMGFRVVGAYGRPEAMSTKEVVRLVNIGRNRHVVAVVDNLQSGPETGKGLAETLGKPHIVLSNFPTKRGYLATLKENVHTVLTALEHK